MKVAIIHEALTVYGGAEKVLEELCAIFPQAPVFVPMYDPAAFPESIRSRDIRSTWLDKLPLSTHARRGLFPFYPMAMHSMDLTDYDVVISSSFNFAHNVVTQPETIHISYCHSPARFLWDFNSYADRENLGRVGRTIVGAMLPFLRTLDRGSAQGVDQWISTSRLVESRIRKFYGKPSTILAPPISIDEFKVAENGPGDYYLLLMRLVGWKRADIAVEACNRLGLKLIVAGDGRDLQRLRSIAGPTIQFVGRVDGAAKADLYTNCKALILPTIEDFGITPLESMASGRPVIALGKGGALDTVVPGYTGEFFYDQTVESLVEVLETFDESNYDPRSIRAHASHYDSAYFRERMLGIVDEARRAAGHTTESSVIQIFRATNGRNAQAV